MDQLVSSEKDGGSILLCMKQSVFSSVLSNHFYFKLSDKETKGKIVDCKGFATSSDHYEAYPRWHGRMVVSLIPASSMSFISSFTLSKLHTIFKSVAYLYNKINYTCPNDLARLIWDSEILMFTMALFNFKGHINAR